MLLSIETSAINRAAKTDDGLGILRGVLGAEGLRPAIGIHAIYELSKMLWDERNAPHCRDLFQLVLDLDPAFLVPTDRLLEYELRRLQRGESVIPFLMGEDLEATKGVVTRLAQGQSDDEAIQFTKTRERAIERTRLEDQQHVERLREAREQGDLPAFRSFEELVEYYRPDVAEVIQPRFKGRIDSSDAQRFAARLDEFPALRTTVRADLHFMFIRAVGGRVPSRDKTADYRHVIDASYCAGILIDDRKLLRKVPLLNSQLRAIGWPQGPKARAVRSMDAAPDENGTSAPANGPSGRSSGRRADKRPGRTEPIKAAKHGSEEAGPCIYCGSTTPPSKREHAVPGIGDV